MLTLTLATRYSSAGLAHGAADAITADTGKPHVMHFAPRSPADRAPFIVRPVAGILTPATR